MRWWSLRHEAREIIDNIVTTIQENWDDAVDLGGLTEVDRDHLWSRQFLNPFALYGYAPPMIAPGYSGFGGDARGG